MGVLSATLDMEIAAEEPGVAAFSLGRQLPYLTRAGSGPLWRDWRPRPSSVRIGSGDTAIPTGASEARQLRLSSTATATASGTSRAAPGPSPGPPTFGWRVRALPGEEELDTQGSHVGGSIGRTTTNQAPLPSSWSEPVTLWFDPPSPNATALQVVLDELFIFRTGASPIVAVPAPRRGDAVDLRGYVLSCGAERIELSHWEPLEDSNPRLVLSSTVADRLPDVRVLWDDSSSTSIRLDRTDYGGIARTPDGGIAGTLLTSSELLSRRDVRLAVRMVGTPTKVPPLVIRLAET